MDPNEPINPPPPPPHLAQVSSPAPPPPPRRDAMGGGDHSGYPEPPLEDPYHEGGFVTALFQTIKGALFNPVTFFKGMREDRSPVPAVVLCLICICLSSFVNQLLPLAMGHNPMDQFLEAFENLGLESNPMFEQFLNETSPSSMTTSFVAAQLFWIPISTTLTFFIMVAFFYLSAYIWGAFAPRFTMYLRVFSYASLPTLFGMIPVVLISPPLSGPLQLCIAFYSATLLFIGMQQAGRGDAGRVVGAIVTPPIFFCLLCCLCIVGFTVFFGALAQGG